MIISMYKIAVIMQVNDKHKESLIKASQGNVITFYDKPLTREEIGQYNIIVGGPDPKLLKEAVFS